MFSAIRTSLYRIAGNAQIKLVFPSHGLPFLIPYSKFEVLVALIDKILTDMAKKDPSLSASRKLKLPNGLILDPPSPGDWVLVDICNATIIHDSLATDLIRVGYTYMVLPMRVSSLSPDELKVAIKVVQESWPGAAAHTPPPDYAASV